MPAALPDVPEVREDFADYCGEIQALDAAVGRIWQKLEKDGLLENTMIVLSGDHGPPGFPDGKCNLYDFGTQVPLLACGPKIQPGRRVEDLVSLIDLAPTFLELAGLPVPAQTSGRSLVPLLHAAQSGVVDPSRRSVIIGRERHVENAREGALPYPQRALRTVDFLYIRNYAPERTPMGDAGKAAPGRPDMSTIDLESDTRSCFADMDAGPTKAWLVRQSQTEEGKKWFQRAFELRPAEELYALGSDPWQQKNLAADPAHASKLAELRAELETTLKKAGDPRVTGDGKTFDQMPYTTLEK
jgi:arylsulfatase A-like enzyme